MENFKQVALRETKRNNNAYTLLKIQRACINKSLVEKTPTLADSR